MKAQVTQSGCAEISTLYTIPTGDSFTRKLILDGVNRISNQDPDSQTYFYEKAIVNNEGIWIEGYKEVQGKRQSYFFEDLKISSSGVLVNHLEEFNESGVSQGPVTYSFIRD